MGETVCDMDVELVVKQAPTVEICSTCLQPNAGDHMTQDASPLDADADSGYQKSSWLVQAPASIQMRLVDPCFAC